MIKKYLLFLYFFCFYIANSFAQVALLPIGSTSGNAYSGFIANKHSFAYNQELNVLLLGIEAVAAQAVY